MAHAESDTSRRPSLNHRPSDGLNISTKRLETSFWTSLLGIVSDWWHWRLGLVSISRLYLCIVSVSALYVSFTTLVQSHRLVIEAVNSWINPLVVWRERWLKSLCESGCSVISCS